MVMPLLLIAQAHCPNVEKVLFIRHLEIGLMVQAYPAVPATGSVHCVGHRQVRIGVTAIMNQLHVTLFHRQMDSTNAKLECEGVPDHADLPGSPEASPSQIQ